MKKHILLTVISCSAIPKNVYHHIILEVTPKEAAKTPTQWTEIFFQQNNQDYMMLENQPINIQKSKPSIFDRLRLFCQKKNEKPDSLSPTAAALGIEEEYNKLSRDAFSATLEGSPLNPSVLIFYKNILNEIEAKEIPTDKDIENTILILNWIEACLTDSYIKQRYDVRKVKPKRTFENWENSPFTNALNDKLKYLESEALAKFNIIAELNAKSQIYKLSKDEKTALNEHKKGYKKTLKMIENQKKRILKNKIIIVLDKMRSQCKNIIKKSNKPLNTTPSENKNH